MIRIGYQSGQHGLWRISAIALLTVALSACGPENNDNGGQTSSASSSSSSDGVEPFEAAAFFQEACVTCHAILPGSPYFAANMGQNVVDSSLQELANTIAATMPPVNYPGYIACDGPCPTAMAEYIKEGIGQLDPQAVDNPAPQSVGEYAIYPYNVVGRAGCDAENIHSCVDFSQGRGTLSGNQGTIDNNIGYQGGSSLRLETGQGFLSMDVPGPDFWARVFVRGAPGPNADNSLSFQHGTLLKARDGAKEMRVGDHRCQLEINRDGGGWDDLEMLSGDWGADETTCTQDTGARMRPNTWYCLEVHYNGPESEVRIFWDNQNVEKLHVHQDRNSTDDYKTVENGFGPGGQHGDATQPWGPANYTRFELGHEVYHGNERNTFWFANPATGTQRIGCGPDYEIKESLHESTRHPGYAEEEGLIGLENP